VVAETSKYDDKECIVKEAIKILYRKWTNKKRNCYVIRQRGTEGKKTLSKEGEKDMY
jgi:hypothetical protein